MSVTKICTGCGLPKELDKFPKNGTRKTTGNEVRGTKCNKCRRKYMKEYFLRRKEERRKKLNAQLKTAPFLIGSPNYKHG